MDFVQKSGIKIPNAVIVRGVTQVAESDEQVIDFLKKHGKIERFLMVDDPQSEFYKNLIVEYTSGVALESLEPYLPYTCTAKDDSNTVYEVETLSSAYATKVGSNVTKTYLTELKQLAKLSGKEYSEVLKEMMSQIGEDVETLKSTDGNHSPTHVETTVSSPPCPEGPQFHTSNFPDVPPSSTGATDAAPITDGRRAPSLSLSDVNPPDIQKVVVEHIVTEARHCAIHSISNKTPLVLWQDPHT